MPLAGRKTAPEAQPECQAIRGSELQPGKSRKRYEELYAKLLAKKGWHPTPRLVSRK